jgi:hypothetical protein
MSRHQGTGFLPLSWYLQKAYIKGFLVHVSQIFENFAPAFRNFLGCHESLGGCLQLVHFSGKSTDSFASNGHRNYFLSIVPEGYLQNHPAKMDKMDIIEEVLVQAFE